MHCWKGGGSLKVCSQSMDKQFQICFWLPLHQIHFVLSKARRTLELSALENFIREWLRKEKIQCAGPFFKLFVTNMKSKYSACRIIFITSEKFSVCAGVKQEVNELLEMHMRLEDAYSKQTWVFSYGISHKCRFAKQTALVCARL